MLTERLNRAKKSKPRISIFKVKIEEKFLFISRSRIKPFFFFYCRWPIIVSCARRDGINNDKPVPHCGRWIVVSICSGQSSKVSDLMSTLLEYITATAIIGVSIPR